MNAVAGVSAVCSRSTGELANLQCQVVNTANRNVEQS